MNASANPGCDLRSLICRAHSRAMVGDTMKPSLAYSIAGSNRSANPSLPNFSDSARHADTAPGTVTESQPRLGISFLPAKRCGFHAAGERPEAFKPRSLLPSHRIANASEPIPFEV